MHYRMDNVWTIYSLVQQFFDLILEEISYLEVFNAFYVQNDSEHRLTAILIY